MAILMCYKLQMGYRFTWFYIVDILLILKRNSSKCNFWSIICYSIGSLIITISWLTKPLLDFSLNKVINLLYIRRRNFTYSLSYSFIL